MPLALEQAVQKIVDQTLDAHGRRGIDARGGWHGDLFPCCFSTGVHQ